MIVTITETAPGGSRYSSDWHLTGTKAYSLAEADENLAPLVVSSVEELIEKMSSGFHFHHGYGPSKIETTVQRLDRGEYHPRVYRDAQPSGLPDLNPPARADAMRHLTMLFSDTQDVFQVIYPDQDNLKVYGDRIRQLLMLCSMEVESHLASALKENGYKAQGNLTITDFKKVEPFLGLSRYGIFIPQFPLIEKRLPFADFAKKTPSWWKAYNAVKHDREGCLKSATVEMLLDALAAVAVVCYAQFGTAGPLQITFEGLSTGGVYYPSLDGVWTPRPYF